MTASMVRILGLLGAALLLASCSGPFFSKVEVKASPTVYAALGVKNYVVSDFLSIQKVRDALGSSSGATVYDYKDGTDTQKFLVHYPLTTVPLDIASYLNNVKLDSSLSQSLTPGTFEVPKVNASKTESGDFDINTTLFSSINGGLASKTTKFVETGLASPPAQTLPEIAITVSDFTTATFATGSAFLLAFDPMTGTGPGLVLTANSVVLKDGNGNTLTQSNSPINLVAGGTATLPLDNVTLTKSLKLSINVSTSQGSQLQEDTITVKPSLAPGSKISGATGISIDIPITVPAVSVPMSASTLVSATVGTGAVTIKLDPLPAGWTGFSRTTNVSISQSGAGGLSVSKTNQVGEDISLSLDGQTMNTSAIAVNASGSIKATDASFSGLGSGKVTFGVTAAADVSLFTSIKVAPGSTFTPSQNIKKPVTDDLKKWVTSIHFTKVGVSFNITNSLPPGNNLTLAVDSNAFEISTATPTSIPARVLATDAATSTTADFFKTGLTFLPNNFTDFDFTVKLIPTSWNGTTMDLYNIVPGTPLSISGTVTLVSDWDTAVVNPGSSGFSGKFPADGSKSDLSKLKDYLGTGLNFQPIQSYLYVSGLPGASMTGWIQGQYASNSQKLDILGTPTNAAAITMLAAPPSFPVGDTYNGALDVSTTSAPLGDLSAALNDKPADFWIDYALKVGLLTINNSATQPKEIKADLVVLFPLVLNTTAGAVINLDKSMPTGDLFGRKSGGDNSNIDNMIDKLTSMTLTLNTTNTTGIGGTATLTDGTVDFNKPLTLSANSSPQAVTFVLTKAELIHLKNKIPFEPKLEISGLPSTLSVKRGGSINATITVNAVTDIDQTFNLRGTN